MPPSITTKQRRTSPVTNPIAVRVLTPIGQDPERALVALWVRDWQDSRKHSVMGAADIDGTQSRKVVLESLPTARRILQENLESFEAKALQLTPRDFASFSFYSHDPGDISAILLAASLCWDGPKWQSLGDAEARQREQAETTSLVEAGPFDDDDNDLDDEFRPVTREYRFEGRRHRRRSLSAKEVAAWLGIRKHEAQHGTLMDRVRRLVSSPVSR
jgi:hypothetical protein